MKKNLIAPLLALTVAGLATTAANADTTTSTENLLVDIGNQILVDYNNDKIPADSTFSEVNKRIGKVSVPKSSKLEVIMNYSAEAPANFSLCAWDPTEKGASATKARGYYSESGTTTAALIDCSSFADNKLEVTPVEKYTPTERPEIDPIEFVVNNVNVTADAEAAPVAEKESGSWAMLFWILAGIVAIPAVFALIAFSRSANRKNRKARAKEKEFIQSWSNSTAEHDKVVNEFNNYRLDPVKILKYPLLNDRTNLTTREFHSARSDADSLRVDEIRVQRDRDPNPYRVSVNKLSGAFEVAMSEAKRKQWSGFTKREQERLSRAQALLNVAMDRNASEAERQTAYTRLKKEIDGIITLPDEAIVSIEKITRPEIMGKV